MNDFEEIKDLNGKSYIAFGKEEEEDKNKIGNKPDDFEILALLGEGQFGKVYKVISKLNNKIYAMKIVDLGKLKEQDEHKSYQLAMNESKFLTVLSHPNIIKYYNNFLEGDYLYIIVENAENGDMADFIQAHKKGGRHIPEEELWNIFLQSMKGLEYVHSMGVIHRDIKPRNLLMDNNMTIKLGDFGVSAVKMEEDDENKNESIKYLNASYRNILSEEGMQCNNTLVFSPNYGAKEMMDRNDYDQKIDVYSMGVTFYELCYFHKPREKGNDDNVHYSKEMLNMINEMLEDDKNKRKPSKYFLTKIREEFSKKYNRNTSIDAIVRCLYTCADIRNYYKQLKKGETKDKPITQAYIDCLQKLTGKDKILYINSIKYFREILCSENSKFDKTKEINPKLVLAFLIRKLHDEININIPSYNKANNYYVKFGEELFKTSKVEMMLNFEKKYFTQLNSYISQKIMGLFKKVFICQKCSMRTYSFLGYFTVTVDVQKISRYIEPNIENYFFFQNQYYTIEEKYCIYCLVPTQHKIYYQFFTVPDYLIVIINRGEDFSCRISVILKPKIDLTKLVETQGKKYKLNGFIIRNYENERYESFIKFKSNTGYKWFGCQNDNNIEYNQNEIKKMFNDPKGGLIMAFYEAL